VAKPLAVLSAESLHTTAITSKRRVVWTDREHEFQNLLAAGTAEVVDLTKLADPLRLLVSSAGRGHVSLCALTGNSDGSAGLDKRTLPSGGWVGTT